MNKRINFEDTIFILNTRIRMIQDLIKLDTDPALFYNQTIGDVEFVNLVLDALMEKYIENLKFLDRETEADNLMDAEWQFSQLLNVIISSSSPFSINRFPEAQALINKLKKDSQRRQKQIEDSNLPNSEHSSTEPVVSHAELNGLLGA